MSGNISSALHPVILLSDRYGGTYSDDAWIAVRDADELFETVSRAAWVVAQGPSGSDLEASAFWSEPPEWVATGASPEAALRALAAKGE